MVIGALNAFPVKSLSFELYSHLQSAELSELIPSLGMHPTLFVACESVYFKRSLYCTVIWSSRTVRQKTRCLDRIFMPVKHKLLLPLIGTSLLAIKQNRRKICKNITMETVQKS